ncbi:MAG: PEP-CTERM sorting domain-containing protein, partial [Pirellulales bacterium]
GEQTQQLTLSLMAQAILAGDFNRDNVVDAADYGVWRKSYGQSVPQYTGGDGDGDGTIGDGDYNVWQTNFGTTAAGSGEGRFSAAVPEPASVLLLAIGFVTACHCLRRADLRLNPRKALLAPMR